MARTPLPTSQEVQKAFEILRPICSREPTLDLRVFSDQLMKSLVEGEYYYETRAPRINVSRAPRTYKYVLSLRELLLRKVKAEDIVFLLYVFMTRGNNIDKIATTMKSKEASNRLKALRCKLSITSRAFKDNSVTLSRVASAYPEVASAILLKKPDLPGIVSWDFIKQRVGYDDFPVIATQPFLACLLPKDLPDTELILNTFFISKMMICEKVNVKRMDWNKMTPEQKADETKAYQIVDFNSALPDSEGRVTFCEKFHIIENGQYTEKWKLAGEKSKAHLLEVYGVSF